MVPLRKLIKDAGDLDLRHRSAAVDDASLAPRPAMRVAPQRYRQRISGVSPRDRQGPEEGLDLVAAPQVAASVRNRSGAVDG